MLPEKDSILMTGMHSDCSRVVLAPGMDHHWVFHIVTYRDNSGLKLIGFSFISHSYFSSLFGKDSARPLDINTVPFHIYTTAVPISPTHQNSLRTSLKRIWPSPEIPYINLKTEPPRDFNSHEYQKKKKKKNK